MSVKPTDPFTSGPYPTKRVTRKEGGVALRLADPRVREHVARTILRHNMDYEAACGKMLPAKATREQVIALAQTLESDPRVRAELESQLRKLGLDDESFKEFFATLWYWLKDKSNDRRFAVAARIMGEAYGIGARKDAGKKPTTLAIKGFEDGVARMFDGAAPSGIIGDEGESVQ